PSGFITHSERPLNLFRRHSLTRLEQKQHGEEPCFERKVCVVKNRLRRDAELVVAFRALKLLLVASSNTAWLLQRKPRTPKGQRSLFKSSRHRFSVSSDRFTSIRVMPKSPDKKSALSREPIRKLEARLRKQL